MVLSGLDAFQIGTHVVLWAPPGMTCMGRYRPGPSRARILLVGSMSRGRPRYIPRYLHASLHTDRHQVPTDILMTRLEVPSTRCHQCRRLRMTWGSGQRSDGNERNRVRASQSPIGYSGVHRGEMQLQS